MQIKENVILKDYSTFKIGGKARFFCTIQNEDDLIEAIGFTKKNKIRTFILGDGSNLLFSDEGFNGLVIKMEMKGIEYQEIDENTVRVRVFAGENWDSFVEKAVERGLYGIENLSGIPGTVGASAVQNIGAYGSEVKDTIDSVYVLDIEKDEYVTFTNSECRFDYRDSIFKHNKDRYVVLYIDFILNRLGHLNINYKDIKEYIEVNRVKNYDLKDIRKIVLNIRKNKLPDLDIYGTAGSFFKNAIVSRAKAEELLHKYPNMIVYSLNSKRVKIPTAWILDHICGFRGARVGDVGTYKNQALVLVNYGKATCQNVINFAQDMVNAVYEKTGIEIEPEVEYVE